MRNAGGCNDFTVLQVPGQHALLTACGEVKALEGLTDAFHDFKETLKKHGEKLFSRAWSGRIKGNGLKMKENKFWLETRKKFFYS